MKVKHSLRAQSALGIAVVLGLECFASSVAYAQLLPESDEETRIEEVIVQGTKIDRSLEDTVDSVAVFSEKDFEEQTLLSLSDVYTLAPNVYQVGNGEGFGIRGVTQTSSSVGGSGTGALGTTYIDGVALTGFALRFGPTDLWDVEQVTVLRGPQSSNVGRSALIGATVITNNRPDLEENDFAFRVGYGSYDQQTLAGMANLKLGDNSALRLSAESITSDGFITNTTLNDDKYDERENQNFRIKWLYQLSDNLSVLASYQKSITERGEDLFISELSSSLDARETTSNLRGSEDYDLDLLSLDVSVVLNDNWTLQSITSLLDAEYDRFNDDDQTAGGGRAFRGRDSAEKNWSEELRLNYSGDSVRGVIGLYYTDIDIDNETLGLVNVDPRFAGVPAALLPFYPALIEVDASTPYFGETKNSAIFTEWEFDLNDNWSMFAGLRYDREDKSNQTIVENSLVNPNALPDPIQAGLAVGGGELGAKVAAGVTQVNAALQRQLTRTDEFNETDYDAFLPQVGVTHHFSDDTSLSAFVKRGYRAGDAEIEVSGNLNQYDPEYLTTYELALRTNLGSDRAFLTSNVYYSDWTDQQVSVARNGNAFDRVTQNAGESELSGFEVAVNFDVNDQFSAFANYGYSKAEFTRFLSATDGDLSGNRFALSPKTTAAIGANFDMTERFSLGANVTYQSDMFADVQNEILLDSKTLVNLNAIYQAESYNIRLYAKNLTNELYKITEGESNIRNPKTGAPLRVVKVGAPREVGIEFNYNF